MGNDAELAAQVMERIEALARISDETGLLVRTFGSPALRRANDLVAAWMRESGMTTREDAIGNLIGRFPGADADAKTLLLGSHLDTVRDAGKFDGPLGVLTALACVQRLRQQRQALPFAIEVIGFADEEGVRFNSPYLGSRALAGTFDRQKLCWKDSKGVAMAEVIRQFGGNPDALDTAKRDPADLLGYVEVHIEQGPALEAADRSVGTVTGIAGQMRARFAFTGRAGHAGTTPMRFRQDALSAAAEFALAIEDDARRHEPLLMTIGMVSVNPHASNVIPRWAGLSLDLRHPSGAELASAWQRVTGIAERIASQRNTPVAWEEVQEMTPVTFSNELLSLLREAARRHQGTVPELFSGAGHDAATLAELTPVAMLFVRCKEGISHHPDESVQTDDVRVAIAVLNDFLQALARKHHG